jgi:hypothetical protein
LERTDIAFVVAFGVAIIGGGLAQRYLRESFGPGHEAFGGTRSVAPLVGHVERDLYVMALLAAQPLFIGLWLTLKTLGSAEILGRWGSAADFGQAREFSKLARQTYQRFLTLAGLSLLWAVGGWAMGEGIEDSRYWATGLIGAGLVAGTYFLWLISPGVSPRVRDVCACWRSSIATQEPLGVRDPEPPHRA